jgi:predicted dehydrogenase
MAAPKKSVAKESGQEKADGSPPEFTKAQELAALSRRVGRVLQVGHITRFYRAIQELPQRVSAPYLIEARRLSSATRNRDVGAILDLMIHDIDIVLSLVASPLKDCTVAAHHVNGSGIEDVAAAQMVFENGCIARLLASRLAPDAERTLIVAEPDQTLRLDFDKFPNTELAIYRPLPAQANGEHHQVEHILVRDENPLRAEIEHFLARVRGTAEPIGTLDDDVRALTLANRLRAQLTAAANGATRRGGAGVANGSANGASGNGGASLNGHVAAAGAGAVEATVNPVAANGSADLQATKRNGSARVSPRPEPRT